MQLYSPEWIPEPEYATTEIKRNMIIIKWRKTQIPTNFNTTSTNDKKGVELLSL